MMNRKSLFSALGACCLLLSAGISQAYEAHVGFTGLILNNEEAYQGYTLMTPSFMAKQKTVYLMDMNGQLVHKWDLPDVPLYAELLKNGNILVSMRPEDCIYSESGGTGRLMEIDWDGKPVMDVTMNTPKHIMHHGFDRMPNGNTLVLTWEWHSWDEAIKKGRDPEKTFPRTSLDRYSPTEKGGIWPVNVVEIDKTGKIVWEWHSWDHLGMGADKMNLNFTLNYETFGPAQHSAFNYFNAVRYNEKSDKVLVTCRNFGEVIIIDRKTGKIEWRFGNPGTWGGGKLPFGYGENGDQKLFGPHDPQWLPDGKISLFNNGTYRPDGGGSAIEVIDPATNKIVWEYTLPANAHNSFYSPYQSSAQLLPNGNFFVNSTVEGHLFEVTPTKNIVWEYINPIFADGPQCLKVSGLPQANMVHRSYRYGVDYPGFAGKDMTPQGPLNPGCPDISKLVNPLVAY